MRFIPPFSPHPMTPYPSLSVFPNTASFASVHMQMFQKFKGASAKTRSSAAVGGGQSSLVFQPKWTRAKETAHQGHNWGLVFCSFPLFSFPPKIQTLPGLLVIVNHSLQAPNTFLAPTTTPLPGVDSEKEARG